MKSFICFRNIFSLILLCAAFPLLAGESVSVRFFVGSVTIDMNDMDKNILPVLGKDLPESAVIRTGKGSTAELSVGGKSIVVKENTAIKVSDVAKLVPGKDTFFNGFHSVVDKLIEPSGKLTVASVRAEKVPAEPKVKWEGEEEGESAPQHSSSIEEEAAREKYGQGDYAAVVASYESEWKALNYETCTFYAGLSYLKLCRYDDAQALFSSLQMSSDGAISSSSLFYLGVACAGQGNLKEAEKSFSRYIEKNPSGEFTPLAYYLKGMALARQGKKKESHAALESVVKKYPSDPAAIFAREALSSK